MALSNRALRADSLLLVAAAIWGFAFVAQRIGMEHVGPFTFNGVRFLLGTLSLLVLLAVRRRRRPAGARRTRFDRSIWLPGLLAGSVLFLGATFQQVGLVYTTAGKAGFITGLYVVFVPLLGLVLRHRVGLGGWAGALVAAAGLYLLSVREGLTLAPGDGLVLIGALFWAGHVQVIGRFSRRIDPILLATMQCAVCAVLSLTAAAGFETVTTAGLRGATPAILYGGILSVGVAYTLQIVAQRDAGPAAAAVLLSLESVFAALGGWWLLGETLSPRGLAGCGLMFAGVLISQLGGEHDPEAEADALRAD